MERHKRRWKVVLEAEAPLVVRDCVASSGMGPGKEEAAPFCFAEGH